MVEIVDLVLTGAIAAICSLLGSAIMWLFVGPKVVERGLKNRAGPAIYEWLVSPSIDTGKIRSRVTDEGEKEEYREVLSPLQNIIQNAGELMYQKLMGRVGGDARKRMAVERDIQEGLLDPANPFAVMLNGINPRLLERAIRDGDYVPILLQQFGPVLQQFVEKKLKGDSPSQF